MAFIASCPGKLQHELQGAITCRPHTTAAHPNQQSVRLSLLSRSPSSRKSVSSHHEISRRQLIASALAALLVPSKTIGLEDKSETEKALNELKRVTALQNLAFELTNQQKFSEAEVLWTKIISLNETNAAAYSNRGNCRTSQGKFVLAIEDFDRAIELAPQEPDPFLGKGVALERLGRYRDALVAYKDSNELSIVKYRMSDPVAINNIGNAYAALGEWQSAYENYKRAANMDSRFVFALANEALALYQLEQDESALRTIRFLARKYPNFADVHAVLAMNAWERGDRLAAEDQWYTAVEQDSRYTDLSWVRDIRRWPPRLLKALESFQTLATKSTSSV